MPNYREGQIKYTKGGIIRGIILAKHPILEVWQRSEYAYVQCGLFRFPFNFKYPHRVGMMWLFIEFTVCVRVCTFRNTGDYMGSQEL